MRKIVKNLVVGFSTLVTCVAFSVSAFAMSSPKILVYDANMLPIAEYSSDLDFQIHRLQGGMAQLYGLDNSCVGDIRKQHNNPSELRYFDRGSDERGNYTIYKEICHWCGGVELVLRYD